MSDTPELPGSRRILAFGAGLDSTAILAAYLCPSGAAQASGSPVNDIEQTLRAIPLDAVMFADPGAEFPETYANVETAKQHCDAFGLPFHLVTKTDRHGDRLKIQDWLLRNGTIPLMPGGRHVCSLKFKGEVLQRSARRIFPGDRIQWLIGIENNETYRSSRFQADPTAQHLFSYPLQELGWDREACERVVLALWPHPVRKSSCVFCPFMQPEEIEDLATNYPDEWSLTQEIETKFAETSEIKFTRWVMAGKPRNGAGRAPVGMWSRNSWSEGRRLFAKRIDGKQISTSEWAERIKR